MLRAQSRLQLLGAECNPFRFEIDFHIFEVVENILTQNPVDLPLCGAGEVLRIHNQHALVFPDGRPDGQRGLPPATIADETRAFARRFGAREAGGIEAANFRAQDGCI